MKKNNVLSIILKAIACAVVIFIDFWITLPPINLRSGEFWFFVISCIVICMVVYAFSSVISFIKRVKIDEKRGFTVEGKSYDKKDMKKPVKFAALAIALIVVFMIGVSAVGWEVFNASAYNKLMVLNDGDFKTDVAELSMSQIPVVDRDTATRLGKRKLGEMSDLVSQFEINENYTQINYKGKPARVTPLAYGDPIKWLNNQSSGIPAYIKVDMTTQETELVRLKEGIKYSESEYFMRNIYRYLRFNYPTKIFDDISFEIDESGVPYWVASTVKFRIAYWSGRDIGGAVLVNAITGESKYYDLAEIPTWVDQVYSADMVIEQLSYNGKYRSGFFNSVFGQKGVLQPTEGYNYLAINDDVWLYTGMTSVTSDESNVGFVLINLRTKESKFYAIPGAEEYSAMESAEGQVQNLKYVSTFPLLLNVSDRPTYFVSLKDDAGLVKMYAFIDVEQYQIVGTGNSVDAARKDYVSKLKDENMTAEPETEKVKKGGLVESIATAVVNGNTKYYIKFYDDKQIYTVDISLSDMLPFTVVGDAADVFLDVSEDGSFTVSGFRVYHYGE
ncbi:MAG: CvpA family protein [Clostridia bacterium]|nr:CvpA family protein [Clostridia bacterium]